MVNRNFCNIKKLLRKIDKKEGENKNNYNKKINK